MHDPGHLRTPSDDGVELALPRESGQVETVALQRPVSVLGPGIGYPVGAPDLLKGLVDLLQVDAELLEYLGHVSMILLGQGHEDVLGPDELVVEAVRLGFCHVEEAGGPRRDENLIGLGRGFGSRVQQTVETVSHGLDRDPQRAQDLRRDPVFQLQDRHKDVLGIPLAVPVAAQDLLRAGQDLLGLFGKLVGSKDHLFSPGDRDDAITLTVRLVAG